MNYAKKLWETGVRQVIKHREFSSLDATHNARIGDETYHHRSVVESDIRSLKQRLGDTLRARTWFGRFRELTLKATVNILETALSC